MKNNTKSSITLPPEELALVLELQKSLKAKSKVDVIRKGLQKLKESVDREHLKVQFSKAAILVKEGNKKEMANLDNLTSEGLKRK
jgi:accessory colonization factor AcfC